MTREEQGHQDDAAADSEKPGERAPDEAEGGQEGEEHGVSSIVRGSEPHKRPRGQVSRGLPLRRVLVAGTVAG
jgi:hypothetical protein